MVFKNSSSKYSLQTTTFRREDMGTADNNDREQMQKVESRGLVSEQGGIFNVALGHNEFELPGTEAKRYRQKKLNSLTQPKRAVIKNNLVKSYDEAELVTKQSSVVGDRAKEKAPRFLVELMSPFASKAGTQGITSNKNISLRTAREPHREGGYFVKSLSPLAKTLINLSQKPQNALDPLRSARKVEANASDSLEVVAPGTGSVPPTQDSLYELTTYKESIQQGSIQEALNNPFATDRASRNNIALPKTNTTKLCQASREQTSIERGFTQHEDHDRLPYMTCNSSYLAAQRKSQPPQSLSEKVKMLPLNVQTEIKNTQQEQLFEFYQAMLQPSTMPFTHSSSVAHITPKIGDKVSMLANVRETLTKRYQLARSARVEAQRRLQFIEWVRDLRGYICTEIDYRPMVGMQDQ